MHCRVTYGMQAGRLRSDNQDVASPSRTDSWTTNSAVETGLAPSYDNGGLVVKTGQAPSLQLYGWPKHRHNATSC